MIMATPIMIMTMARRTVATIVAPAPRSAMAATPAITVSTIMTSSIMTTVVAATLSPDRRSSPRDC